MWARRVPPKKCMIFDMATGRSKIGPFLPKMSPNILSPMAARFQRKSMPHGRRVVPSWSAARGGGPVPEGRPYGPRPSPVSRTTGMEPPVAGFTLLAHNRPRQHGDAALCICQLSLHNNNTGRRHYRPALLYVYLWNFPIGSFPLELFHWNYPIGILPWEVSLWTFPD